MSCRRVCTRVSSGGLYVDPKALVPRSKLMSFQLAPLLAKHHFTHPMRKDVKQKHFRTLSMRPRSVLASRPLVLRGEDFGFNAWSVTEYARDTDRFGWSALSGLMPRSRHHRCKAAQANRWLKCQPSSYVSSRACGPRKLMKITPSRMQNRRGSERRD
jgi:hypothetical protein